MSRSKTNEEGDEDEKVFSDNDKHKKYSLQMRSNTPNRSSGTKGREKNRQVSMNFAYVLDNMKHPSHEHHVAIIKKVTKSNAVPILTTGRHRSPLLGCIVEPQSHSVSMNHENIVIYFVCVCVLFFPLLVLHRTQVHKMTESHKRMPVICVLYWRGGRRACGPCQS